MKSPFRNKILLKRSQPLLSLILYGSFLTLATQIIKDIQVKGFNGCPVENINNIG